jgi:hypothetical protein
MAKGSSQYFLNFPILNYNGFAATNILARSVIAKKFMENTELFYEYTVKDGETAEGVAFNAYGNSSYVWVLRLFNNNIDPYYSWPLSQEEFGNMITDKYGSWEIAAQQIQYYQNNWAGDDRVLNLNGYDSLPDYLKKYWKPVIRAGNYVYQYKRNPLDTTVSTNQILQIPVANSGSFIDNEKVSQNSATGFVAFSNSSMLTLQHITGAFNNTDIITGNTSGVNASPSGSINQTFVIPNDEAVYYNPVTVLDVEMENNQVRANIKILRNEYLQSVVQSFATEMQS